jgi:hypothetical protein
VPARASTGASGRDVHDHDATDPLEADERERARPDAAQDQAFGLGPLSSLRVSNEAFESSSELKNAGKAAAETRSIISPLSQTSSPVAARIDSERPPKE